MATKREKDGEKSKWQSNLGDADFAAVELLSSDRDAFGEWMKGVQSDFSETLQMTLDESYRVSFKRDYENSCVTCSWTQQDNKHHNKHIVIVSRSEDAEEAFWLNVYKVTILYPGERLPTKSSVNRSWG